MAFSKYIFGEEVPSFKMEQMFFWKKINTSSIIFFQRNATSYRMMPVLELLWPGSVKMDPTESLLLFLVSF